MSRAVRVILSLLLPAAAGLAAGTAAGALAASVSVLGLFGLLVGLAAGASAVFSSRAFEPRVAAAPAAGALLGVGLALAALLVFEDAHQRGAFARDLARSRAADSGLPPEEAARAFDADPEAAVAFLAKDADAQLAAEARRLTGHDGGLGRFLVRQQGGLRLVILGPSITGLPLGVFGGILTYALELAMAWFVYRRVRRAAPT